MKFFLDTANLDEIKEVASLGIIDGVTTNPSLMSKEGNIKVESHVKEICETVKGPVSLEVTASDLDGMLEQARLFSSWNKHIVIKVPMSENGLKAVYKFNQEGIRSNITLVFSANQALLAAKAGADFVSPFLGRLDDDGQDGMSLISEITEIFNNYTFKTEILAASIRHPRHVTECALLGADVVTMPKSVFLKLIQHPKTTIGLEKFMADWKARKDSL